MPCYDPDYRCSDGRFSSEEHERYIKQIQKLTQMLCGLCGVLEKKTVFDIAFIREVDGLHAWWESHKKQDRQRKLKENLQRQKERNRKMDEYNRLKKELGL